MSRVSSNSVLVLVWLCLNVLRSQSLTPPDVLDQAAVAFEQGRAAEADQRLNSFLRDHPNDLRALILKGAVLDTLQRWDAAESYYQQAIRLAPGSLQVLNNLANHYLASGNNSLAREFYLKAIAIDSHHPNANLQLAQMCVNEKKGGQALQYLSKIPAGADAEPGIQLLRARALALDGQCSDIGRLLDQLKDQANPGSNLHFSIGVVFAECKLYDHAEESFSRALDADPTDFDVLYNLGLAALEAGHSNRATSVLETALKQRPDDTDCLLALSRSYLKQERLVDSARLLARARKLAPERADVLLLLAQAFSWIESYRNSALAYDDYLKLKPDDDIARRERGFAFARAGEYTNALSDLDWYARKYPRDAVGLYELSVARAVKDHGKAVESLDQALTIEPSLIQARYSRALLNIEEGKPAAAMEDLRFVLERKPDDPRALAHLGSAYLALDQTPNAAQALKRAADLAPQDPAILVQYRSALLKLGRTQEAALLLARLRTAAGRDQPAKRASATSDDPEGRIGLGRELLADGNITESLKVFRELRSHSSDPALLARCGRILIEFEQYGAALQFLEPAIAADPSWNGARLDLAIAIFHARNPQDALSELDKTLERDRNGDYYLLRAQLLDGLGKVQEAAEMLNRGIESTPTRPDLCLQSAEILLKRSLNEKALALLEQAARAFPDDREVLLAQAVTLAVIPRDADAQKLLAKMQLRWPEWDRPYLVNGIILETQRRSAEARQVLETAIALGAATPQAFYYQALAITHDTPKNLEEAKSAIDRALALASSDPYILLLAGKISLARKEFPEAIDRLERATRLVPTLIPAHYALHDAYMAIGEKQKSDAELEAIQHIADQSPASEKNPFPVGDLVLKARPPG